MQAQVRGEDGGTAAFVDQMSVMIGVMRRTIDALTQQLAGLRGGSRGRSPVGKDSEDLSVMHHKDVDKPNKFGGQNSSTWSIDLMNCLGRKTQSGK